MARNPLYLIGKSAWEQRRYDDRARGRVRDLRESGRLAICIVTMAELLYSARNAAEMATDHERLNDLTFLPMTPAAERNVVITLQALAQTGQHRRPIPDLMTAAIAQAHGATLLHYDRDYELIASITRQAHEWVIPRGTGHGP